MSASPPDPSTPPPVLLEIGDGVALRVRDRPVRLSPTQQAYLLLLAHGAEEGVRRKEVIQVLWDVGSSHATRHRIRQLSYSVNRKAGQTIVRAEGTQLMICSTVEVLWRYGDIGAAVPSPSARFDDRVLEIRSHRKRLASLGSARGLDSARLEDHPDRVLTNLDEGPLLHGAWRDLLWALLRTGRVREAEVEFRRIMGDDLPLESLPTARRVAASSERLLRLATAGAESSIPLLGRDLEVRQVHELLASGASCILVTGARGVGRSRILGQTVAALLSNQEDTVSLGARGMPFERHTPFGGLGQLLNDDVLVQAFHEIGQPEKEIIRRALPVQFESQDLHTLAHLGGPGSYLRVARALADLFVIAYGRAEVMLLVDDLDLLDRSTVEVVTRLVLVSNARLVGTWCTEDETGLNELLFRFRGVDPEIVPLLDLPISDAERLARYVAPELGEKQVNDVARLGGGRPGRIVELLRALEGRPVLSAPLGPSLEELLRRRVRELSPAEQRTLILLALGGGQLGLPVLSELLGCGVLEASGLVRSLEERGLAGVEGDTAVVTSTLLREFVQRELPGPLRRETHAHMADVLLRMPGETDPGLVAHHLMEAGRSVEAADWFKRAGIQARDRTAFAEAMVLLERSVAANDQLDPEIAQALGSIHSGMGDFKQAIHWFGRARLGYVDRGDQVGDVETALQEIGVAMEGQADLSDLVSEAREQLQRAKMLGDTRLEGLALDLWFRLGDYGHLSAVVGQAKSALMQALRADEEADPWIALAGTRLVYLGTPKLGVRLARLAYLGLRSDRLTRISAINRLIITHLVLGLPPSARITVLLGAAERLASGVGDLYARFSILCNRALWSMDSSDWGAADRLFAAAERFTGGPKAVASQTLAANRAVLEVRRGRPRAATPYLEEMDEWLPSAQRSINRVHESCRLIVALEEGRVSDAAEWFERLLEFDPTFPFSADLSLVPITKATYLLRVGRRGEARRQLLVAERGFRPHNPVAGRRISQSLRRIEQGLSPLWVS